MDQKVNNSKLSQLLMREFDRRRKRNLRYSLRSFARDVGVPHSSLSLILAEKRGFSRTMVARVASAFGPHSELARALVHTSRKSPNETSFYDRKRLAADEFSIVADWQHYAILSLIKTDDFRFDHDWIAKRLGISTAIVALSIDRLLKVGFVEVSADGQHLRRTVASLSTTSDIMSKALRSSHRQNILQAVDCLDLVAVEQREISSNTFACDPKRIKVAKQRIRKFRIDLADYLSGGKKSEVYNLNIQLVPVTKLDQQ